MTDDKRAQCSATTDTEIYRRPSPDDTDPDGYYQPYLSITKQGALMICVAGRCITMPIESWLSLAANDKKPDGWVAWHPTEGLYKYVSYGRFIGLTFDDVLDDLKEDYALDTNYLVFCRENLDDPRSESFVSWLAGQGWRIRPVKLVFLDQEPKE